MHRVGDRYLSIAVFTVVIVKRHAYSYVSRGRDRTEDVIEDLVSLVLNS
jgi:hypothetical protein